MSEFSINGNKQIFDIFKKNEQEVSNNDELQLGSVFGGYLDGFITQMTSTKNRDKYSKLFNIFDQNGNGKIEDDAMIDKTEISYWGADIDVSEKQLIKGFFKAITGSDEMPDNRTMKKLLQVINGLDDKQYKELKTFVTAQNGEIPAWLETELDLVESEKLKLDYLGKKDIHTKKTRFATFDNDIEILRQRKQMIEESFNTEKTFPGLTYKEEKTEDGEAKKILTDNNTGKEIYTVTYSKNGNVKEVKRSRPDTDNYEVTTYNQEDASVYTTSIIDGKKQQVLESTFYKFSTATKHSYEYDEKGKLIKEILQGNEENDKRTILYEYQDDIKTKTCEYDYNNELREETFYDAKGRITKDINFGMDGFTTEFQKSYGEKGLETSKYYKNGELITSTKYNEDGSVINTEVGSPFKQQEYFDKGKSFPTKIMYYNPNNTEELLCHSFYDKEKGMLFFDKDDNQISMEEFNKLINSFLPQEGGPSPCPSDMDPPSLPDPVPGPVVILSEDEQFELLMRNLDLNNINKGNILGYDFESGPFSSIQPEQITNSDWNKISIIFSDIINDPDFQTILYYDPTQRKTNKNSLKLLNSLLQDLKDEKISSAKKLDIIKKFGSLLRNPYDENLVNYDKPNGKIDRPSYQYDKGDCWLLETVNAFCRNPKGKELIENCISVDKKTGDVTISLEGGRKKYKVTAKELALSHGNIGDSDIRALVIAMGKYRTEQYNGSITLDKSITGGQCHEAMQILTGLEPLKTNEQAGKLGVTIDSEFVPLNKDNIDKLKNKIINVTPSAENLESLKQFGDRIVILAGLRSHEYSMQFNNEGSIDIHEPWNSERTEKFTLEELRNILSNPFTDISIMIL